MLTVAITVIAAAVAGVLGFRLGTRSDRRYDSDLRLLDGHMTNVAETLRRLADRLGETRVRGDVEERLARELEALLEQIAAEGAPAQAFRRVTSELAAELAGAAHIPRARQPATRDDLTGLRDRRGYESELEREIARARRTGRPLAVAVFDLGDLAEARVRTGQAAVDTLLQEFGALLARVTRATDIVCRPGASYFGVLLPDTTETTARSVRSRVRSEAAAWEFGMLGPLTFSSGIAEWHPDESAQAFGARAFAALGSVGSLGSNRT
jgi:diguanylate cyclase (GGDEF)-like protein